jgi:HK97 family phage portal protein
VADVWPFRKREERALPAGALLTQPGQTGGATFALGDDPFPPEPVDTDKALQHAAVWACVRLLADTVSTMPVDVYRRGQSDTIPTPPLLIEPAAGMPIIEWLYAVMVSLLLRGNAYGLITARSGATLLPAQVELVHPDLVSVQTDPETGLPTYRIGGQAYGRDDVWHVRAFTMPGVFLGLSPVAYCRETIAVGLAAERFGAKFFGDGAIPSGVLSCEQRLGQDNVTLLRDIWNDRYRHRRKVAVLTEGLKFQPISVNPDESQFIETQQFNTTQIARLFGVPAHMIGGTDESSLTYANTESRALDYLRYSVNTWLVRIETALGRLLPRQQYAKLNAGGLLWETPGNPDYRVPVADVEQAIREACRRWQVREIVADPFRWTRSLQALEAEGLPVLEFPQTAQRMTPATTGLYEAVVNGQVTHSGDPRLPGT